MAISFAVLAFASFAAMIIAVLVAAVMIWRSVQRQAGDLGYPTVRAYFQAPARSDAEKRAAVSLALFGVVLCLLGLLFPPLLLVGLPPLFYGGRKVAWASMGLGLVDDGDTSGV